MSETGYKYERESFNVPTGSNIEYGKRKWTERQAIIDTLQNYLDAQAQSLMVDLEQKFPEFFNRNSDKGRENLNLALVYARCKNKNLNTARRQVEAKLRQIEGSSQFMEFVTDLDFKEPEMSFLLKLGKGSRALWVDSKLMTDVIYEGVWVDEDLKKLIEDGDIVGFSLADTGVGYDRAFTQKYASTKTGMVFERGKWGEGGKLASLELLREGAEIEHFSTFKVTETGKLHAWASSPYVGENNQIWQRGNIARGIPYTENSTGSTTILNFEKMHPRDAEHLATLVDPRKWNSQEMVSSLRYDGRRFASVGTYPGSGEAESSVFYCELLADSYNQEMFVKDLRLTDRTMDMSKPLFGYNFFNNKLITGSDRTQLNSYLAKIEVGKFWENCTDLEAWRVFIENFCDNLRTHPDSWECDAVVELLKTGSQNTIISGEGEYEEARQLDEFIASEVVALLGLEDKKGIVVVPTDVKQSVIEKIEQQGYLVLPSGGSDVVQDSLDTFLRPANIAVYPYLTYKTRAEHEGEQETERRQYIQRVAENALESIRNLDTVRFMYLNFKGIRVSNSDQDFCYLVHETGDSVFIEISASGFEHFIVKHNLEEESEELVTWYLRSYIYGACDQGLNVYDEKLLNTAQVWADGLLASTHRYYSEDISKDLAKASFDFREVSFDRVIRTEYSSPEFIEEMRLISEEIRASMCEANFFGRAETFFKNAEAGTVSPEDFGEDLGYKIPTAPMRYKNKLYWRDYKEDGTAFVATAEFEPAESNQDCDYLGETTCGALYYHKEFGRYFVATDIDPEEFYQFNFHDSKLTFGWREGYLIKHRVESEESFSMADESFEVQSDFHANTFGMRPGLYFIYPDNLDDPVASVQDYINRFIRKPDKKEYGQIEAGQFFTDFDIEHGSQRSMGIQEMFKDCFQNSKDASKNTMPEITFEVMRGDYQRYWVSEDSVERGDHICGFKIEDAGEGFHPEQIVELGRRLKSGFGSAGGHNEGAKFLMAEAVRRGLEMVFESTDQKHGGVHWRGSAKVGTEEGNGMEYVYVEGEKRKLSFIGLDVETLPEGKQKGSSTTLRLPDAPPKDSPEYEKWQRELVKGLQYFQGIDPRKKETNPRKLFRDKTKEDPARVISFGFMDILLDEPGRVYENGVLVKDLNGGLYPELSRTSGRAMAFGIDMPFSASNRERAEIDFEKIKSAIRSAVSSQYPSFEFFREIFSQIQERYVVAENGDPKKRKIGNITNPDLFAGLTEANKGEARNIQLAAFYSVFPDTQFYAENFAKPGTLQGRLKEQYPEQLVEASDNFYGALYSALCRVAPSYIEDYYRDVLASPMDITKEQKKVLVDVSKKAAKNLDAVLSKLASRPGFQQILSRLLRTDDLHIATRVEALVDYKRRKHKWLAGTDEEIANSIDLLPNNPFFQGFASTIRNNFQLSALDTNPERAHELIATAEHELIHVFLGTHDYTPEHIGLLLELASQDKT